jgi:hypothetical protein
MLENSTLGFAFLPLPARSPNSKSRPAMNEATIPAAAHFPARLPARCRIVPWRAPRSSPREKLLAFSRLLVDFAAALRQITQDYLHEENWLSLIRPLDTFAAVISAVGR